MFIVKVVLQISNLMMLNKVIIVYFLTVLSGASQENRNHISCFQRKNFNIGDCLKGY